MYINWFNEYIPKLNAFLSFLVNSLLIYLVHNDKKIKLGNYRFLLFFFAIINLISTVGDCLIPFCVLDHKYSFSVFISGGLFEKRSIIGTILLSIRCGFILVSYAILHCHFVYRYMALFMTRALHRYFLPYGMTFTVIYCSLPLTLWAYISYKFMDGNDERRQYLASSYVQNYNVSVFDVNLLVMQFDEGSTISIAKSWFGITIVSLISFISFITDLILGLLITNKLRTNIRWMNQKTRKLQQQLMKALWVQVSIPLFVSFLPCMFAWYRPVFNITVSLWIDQIETVFTSLFAVIDPLALFYFVPTFNRRVREIFGMPRKIDKDEEKRRNEINAIQTTVFSEN